MGTKCEKLGKNRNTKKDEENMTFGEFCKIYDKPVKGLKGIKSKVNIVRFFLDTALGYTTNYEPSYYGKWFNDTEPIHFWNDVCDNYNAEKFVEALRQKISPSASVEVAEKYGIELEEGESPDLHILAKAIAEQFYLIAMNDGSYDGNVINDKYQEFKTPTEWSGYVSRAAANERKCKTLLYRNKAEDIDSFYVWNRISRVQPKNLGFDVQDDEQDNLIQKPSVENIFEINKHILLIGMEGIGKSMMIRNLFLSSLAAYGNTGELPFLICLREYESEHRDLLSLIERAMRIYDPAFNKDDARALLIHGRAIVYMDSLDEIAPSQFGEFHRDLEALTKAYPRSKFLITTRNYTLLSASDFQYLWILPFTKNQSNLMIDKLKIDEGIKDSMHQLIETQLDTYKEYLSIPMLLTMLAINYEKFDVIPSKRHELYGVAYDTLLEIHDREEKDDYEKRFNSIERADEFTPIFSEFCARTCRNGIVSFQRKPFEALIRKVSAVNDVVNPSMFASGKFINDICYKACLMYERDMEYTFLHRSIQEYLFAYYYANADDERLIKLGEYLSNPKGNFHNVDAFLMLYDMAPERVNRLLFLPYLKNIYTEFDERKRFWAYLKYGYGIIRVRYLNEDSIKAYRKISEIVENPRINEPNNFLFLMITQLCKVTPSFSRVVYDKDKKIELIFEDLVVGSMGDGCIDLKNVSKKLLENQLNLYDENSISEDGKTVIFGRDCIYNPEKAISDSSDYQVIQKSIYDKDSELWESYDNVRDFYDELALEYDDCEYGYDDF